MKISMELLTRMHRFRQLRIPERLNMMPKSEHIILKLLLNAEQENRQVLSSDLAKKLSVSAPAISRSIKLMREQGFLQTHIMQSDRRGMVVTLTDKGRQAILDEHNRLETLMQNATSHLSDDEIEQFFSVYDRLLDEIEKELNLQLNLTDE